MCKIGQVLCALCAFDRVTLSESDSSVYAADSHLKSFQALRACRTKKHSMSRSVFGIEYVCMVRNFLFAQLVVLTALLGFQLLGIYLNARLESDVVFVPSHFLGGVWAALLVATYATGFLDRKLHILWYVASAFFFGVGWEIFELLTHIISITNSGYAWESSADIFVDVLGGLVGAAIARYIAHLGGA